jgi:hypothetical protein
MTRRREIRRLEEIVAKLGDADAMHIAGKDLGAALHPFGAGESTLERQRVR